MSTQKDSSENFFNRRVKSIYSDRLMAQAGKTDLYFGYLFIFEWIAGMMMAFWLSPFTWSGDYKSVHIHIYAAVFLGSAIASLPVFLIFRKPGAEINRLIIPVSQMLFSTLFIHLSGGRIETHFHIFGSLAFLAFYRDPKPLMIGTVITAADHLLRGIFWPQSVYGVLLATPWRAFEHSAWILFEDFFLFYIIVHSRRELRSISEGQARLEETIDSIGDQVDERTRELRESQSIIIDQQQALTASAKMSALGEMAGGVAHEINSPLTTIKILSSQIQEGLDDKSYDPEAMKAMVIKLEKTTDRIAKIIQGLRVFSRDGGKDPIQTIDLFKMIEDTLSFCSERFKNHDVELSVESFPKTLTVEGRETEVSQIILNLLNNAFDAISAYETKWVKVSVVESADEIKILVTDCGKGISAEIQTKIFQPFFTTKEIGKGTGMGLSISSGIARQHQGSLTVDKECVHTRFILTLPKKHRGSDKKQAA